MTELIAPHFEGNDDLNLGPVKAVLGDQVQWGDIRFVASHIKFLRRCIETAQKIYEQNLTNTINAG